MRRLLPPFVFISLGIAAAPVQAEPTLEERQLAHAKEQFGLGAHEAFASLTVLWPSGRREELPGGPANRRLTLREGEGIVGAEVLR